jgi:hypothetical protein
MEWLKEGISEAEFFARWSAGLERIRAYHRSKESERRARQPERSRAQQRASYQRHAQRRRKEARDKRAQVSADPLLAQQRRQRDNARRSRRRQTNVHYALRVRLRTRIQMALRRSATSKSTSSLSLLGCSIEQWRRYLEAKWEPGMSWDNYGRGKGCWHIDHVHPCDTYDLTEPKQQALCFYFTNTQPKWAMDNWTKGDAIEPVVL